MNPTEKLRERSNARKQGGDMYTDELVTHRIGGVEWSRGVPLPMADRDLSTFRVHKHSAEALVVPDPVEGELRIPYIVRYYPGDMRALLDALVEKTGHDRIRFVNLSPDGTASAISDVMDVPNPRNLREAVHGFEEITEQWETPSGDEEPVDCLRGIWEVDG